MRRRKPLPGAICDPTLTRSCVFTATVEVPAHRQGRGLAQLLPNERCAPRPLPSLLGSVILAGGRRTGRRFPHRSAGHHNCQVNRSCAFLTRTVGHWGRHWCVVVRSGGERVGRGLEGQSATMHPGLIRRRRLFTYLQSKDKAISLDEAPGSQSAAAPCFFFF